MDAILLRSLNVAPSSASIKIWKKKNWNVYVCVLMEIVKNSRFLKKKMRIN